MRQKLLIICLSFFALKSFGQDAIKTFDEIKNITVRNVGVIKKNNVVKGYYSFYEYDKVDKHTLLFRLNLMDENLNDLGTKDIEGPKDWQLISSTYDGNDFCFKFYDEKAKTIELKVYDDQAKEVTSNTIDLNYKLTNAKYRAFLGLTNSELNVIDSNGFVNYTFNEPNDAYIISYANGANKKTWQQTYEPEGKSKVMIPNFLGGNNDIVLTTVSRIEKGFGNNKTENSIVANDIKNGSQLFDVSTEIDDNHVVPINAVFEGDKITIIGMNYKTAKTYTRAPDGFAFIEMDKKGKILKSNFKTFEETLGKYLPMEGSELADGYYLYIHDIVRTNKNTNLVIAEKFKKAGDAVGIGLTALSMLSGSYSTAEGTIKLVLENMVVIEYDMDGNVIQAKEIPKAKGSTGVIPGSMTQSPYLLATMANMCGWMDYRYTLKNDDNSEITFSFVDYDKVDEDAKKTKNFGQIKYKNGVFSVDKIPIKNEKATLSFLYPAKEGYVMQMNYYKKDKQMTMAFIKLNN